MGQASYNLSIDNGWDSAADDAANIAWSRECWTDLAAISADGVYLNFNSDEGDRLLGAGARSNLDRLSEIKSRFDPQNLFRMNANISPVAN